MQMLKVERITSLEFRVFANLSIKFWKYFRLKSIAILKH